MRLRLVVVWVLILAFTAAGLAELVVVVRTQPVGFDFLPMWTAAREVLQGRLDLYDFDHITRAQSWIIRQDDAGERPFVYPPSALLLFVPFGLAPYWVAYAAWTALTATLFAWAVARETPRRALAAVLVLTVSPSLTVLHVGQTTFLICAMALLALRMLEARPIVAGVLLGLAAAIKPQALVMAPLVLVASGQFRALAGAIAAGTLAGLLSLALFGLGLWLDWLASLSSFSNLVAWNDGLLRGNLTPISIADRYGFEGAWRTAWQILWVATGALFAILVFRKTKDIAMRMAGLFGGALLAAPYAIYYDAALLAPTGVWLLLRDLDRPSWSLRIVGVLLLSVCTFPWLGPLGLIAFLAVAVGPLAFRDRWFSIS